MLSSDKMRAACQTPHPESQRLGKGNMPNITAGLDRQQEAVVGCTLLRMLVNMLFWAGS